MTVIESANRQNAIPFRRRSRSRHLSTWAMQPNMPPGFPQMPGQMPPGYAEQQLLQLQQQQHHQMQQQMQQQQQMPGVTLMLVNVPPNVRVGEQMVVMTPTGQQYMVVVPQGAGPGSQFQIAVPNQSMPPMPPAAPPLPSIPPILTHPMPQQPVPEPPAAPPPAAPPPAPDDERDSLGAVPVPMSGGVTQWHQFTANVAPVRAAYAANLGVANIPFQTMKYCLGCEPSNRKVRQKPRPVVSCSA